MGNTNPGYGNNRTVFATPVFPAEVQRRTRTQKCQQLSILIKHACCSGFSLLMVAYVFMSLMNLFSCILIVTSDEDAPNDTRRKD
jgi:hypothetical protein